MHTMPVIGEPQPSHKLIGPRCSVRLASPPFGSMPAASLCRTIAPKSRALSAMSGASPPSIDDVNVSVSIADVQRVRNGNRALSRFAGGLRVLLDQAKRTCAKQSEDGRSRFETQWRAVQGSLKATPPVRPPASSHSRAPVA